MFELTAINDYITNLTHQCIIRHKKYMFVSCNTTNPPYNYLSDFFPPTLTISKIQFALKHRLRFIKLLKIQCYKTVPIKVDHKSEKMSIFGGIN